jgi:cation diffusion facilitator CzcD-associated flavoprotein CzcO
MNARARPRLAFIDLHRDWRSRRQFTLLQLAPSGWTAQDDEQLPTAGALIDAYLAPLARMPALAPHIHLQARVTAISRSGHDKVKTAGRDASAFILRVETPNGTHEGPARAVVDASGTWAQPNPLGIHGLPALGELENRDHIVYGMPDILGADRARYAGRKVLVVGAGHSASGNLLTLATLAADVTDTHIAWAVRGTELRRLFGWWRERRPACTRRVGSRSAQSGRDRSAGGARRLRHPRHRAHAAGPARRGRRRGACRDRGH